MSFPANTAEQGFLSKLMQRGTATHWIWPLKSNQFFSRENIYQRQWCDIIITNYHTLGEFDIVAELLDIPTHDRTLPTMDRMAEMIHNTLKKIFGYPDHYELSFLAYVLQYRLLPRIKAKTKSSENWGAETRIINDLDESQYDLGNEVQSLREGIRWLMLKSDDVCTTIHKCAKKANSLKQPHVVKKYSRLGRMLLGSKISSRERTAYNTQLKAIGLHEHLLDTKNVLLKTLRESDQGMCSQITPDDVVWLLTAMQETTNNYSPPSTKNLRNLLGDHFISIISTKLGHSLSLLAWMLDLEDPDAPSFTSENMLKALQRVLSQTIKDQQEDRSLYRNLMHLLDGTLGRKPVRSQEAREALHIVIEHFLLSPAGKEPRPYADKELEIVLQSLERQSSCGLICLLISNEVGLVVCVLGILVTIALIYLKRNR
jgi:hypothetical protein